MGDAAPVVMVLAGSNGSGKTTASRTVLAETLRLMTFVNADVIAQGLAGFDPDSAAFEASRIMLARLHALAEQRENFAFETTLAARSYLGWLKGLKDTGYTVQLAYFWVGSEDLAVTRVALRVKMGGHDVPEATIRQRYKRSLHNFFHLYRPIASIWKAFDNSGMPSLPNLIACGDDSGNETILLPERWQKMNNEARP